MKTLVTICALVVLLIAAAPASAYLAELVDLGSAAGEVGYTLNGWGPVWGLGHAGNWGGLATDPQSYDKLCRTVWDISEGVDGKDASITFTDKIIAVEIRHLDGIANDSFDVFVDGVKWGNYADSSPTEVWKITSFTGTPGNTLAIVVTGAQWGSFGTWGQLGIDRVFAQVPEPVTFALLGLGGLFLRRRK